MIKAHIFGNDYDLLIKAECWDIRPSATDKKFRVRERISPRVFGSLVYKSFLTERAFPEEKIYKSSLIERAFPETARRRLIFLIFNF